MMDRKKIRIELQVIQAHLNIAAALLVKTSKLASSEIKPKILQNPAKF
jgi:hypothetical protein